MAYYTVELTYDEVTKPNKRVEVYLQTGIGVGGQDFHNALEEQIMKDYPNEKWCSWKLIGSTNGLASIDFTDETSEEDTQEGSTGSGEKQQEESLEREDDEEEEDDEY